MHIKEETTMKYRNINGYLVPNFSLESSEPPSWGKYGELRLRYLEEHQPILYTLLMIEGKLHCHLLEINQEANRIVYDTIHKMAASQGVNEQMKRSDPLRWVQYMNSFKFSAEEYVMRELIYAEEEH